MSAVQKKDKETKKEQVIVADVITQTSERIEVIQEADPLTDFKEKMAEEEQPLPDSPQEKSYMWPILFIFIIVLVLLTGIFIYRQGIFKKETVNVVSITPTPTVEPSPTPVIDLAQYEIEMLNGGGISGEAGRQKISLEEEGFTVSAIGNADNSDYTETIIKAKKTVAKAFTDRLKDVLGNTFTVGAVEILPEDASTPIVVIIGTKN
ncbi:MAG: LytR C-terminal domain-containing protein [Candidatus Levybacteria bacterium]|nr:LytR C-terminal domain-containing protein [Candidatus Levybacteria bacterium]